MVKKKSLNATHSYLFFLFKNFSTDFHGNFSFMDLSGHFYFSSSILNVADILFPLSHFFFPFKTFYYENAAKENTPLERVVQ